MGSKGTDHQMILACLDSGSHWENRLMKEDVMASVSTDGPARVSPVTLALFEDSGWYTPVYSLATGYTKGEDP